MKIILDNGMELTVKAARINAGLTVGDVASSLNLSKGGYSKKENGHSRFYAGEVSILSNLFNIPLECFCEEGCLERTLKKA